MKVRWSLYRKVVCSSQVELRTVYRLQDVSLAQGVRKRSSKTDTTGQRDEIGGKWKFNLEGVKVGAGGRVLFGRRGSNRCMD